MSIHVQLPTFVYRLYSKSDVLLYVGITDNLRLRMTQHARTQPWWPQVANVEVEIYKSRRAAERAERRAIRNEHPIENVVHAKDDQPLGPSGLPDDVLDLAFSLGFQVSRDAEGYFTFRAPDGRRVVIGGDLTRARIQTLRSLLTQPVTNRYLMIG